MEFTRPTRSLTPEGMRMDRIFSLETTLIDRIMKALFFHRKKSYQTFIRSSKSIIVKDCVKKAFCVDLAGRKSLLTNEFSLPNIFHDKRRKLMLHDQKRGEA